jgi:ubiquinone/menaquinone biosynthesis C-methylase UbiE
LGLQFFADRPGALREMRRVLVTEGRLALMVWCNIGESPGFAALAEILEQNISPAAASIMRAPFGLFDVGELTQLVEAAGFRDVMVEHHAGLSNFLRLNDLF